MKYIQQYIVGQLVKVVVHISRRHFYKGNNSPQCTFAVTVTHSSLPLVVYCGGVRLLACVFVCNRLHISARSVFCLVEELHYKVAEKKSAECLFVFVHIFSPAHSVIHTCRLRVLIFLSYMISAFKIS